MKKTQTYHECEINGLNAIKRAFNRASFLHICKRTLPHVYVRVYKRLYTFRDYLQHTELALLLLGNRLIKSTRSKNLMNEQHALMQ
jgi:hypothetical protein